MRYLILQVRAYRHRERRADLRVIGLRNDVRGAVGADPIDPYDAGRSSSSESDDEEKVEAFLHRVAAATDLDPTNTPDTD